MEIKITGTPEEIKELLQAIEISEKQGIDQSRDGDHEFELTDSHDHSKALREFGKFYSP